MVFNTRAIKDKETQYQITRLTGSRGSLKHDDRVDVLAAAASYWEDTLGLNVDHAIAKNRHREQEEVVSEWLSNNRIYGLLGDKVSGALNFQTSSPPPPKPNKWAKNSRQRKW